LATWGGVDVLVNNACLALFKPFLDRSLVEIRQEIEVNYFGYLNMISAVLPAMCRQGNGVIHNMSSGVGFTGMPGMAGYTSSKGAIESLTRTLALELAGRGIVVNVMHPPLTRTKSASGFGVPQEMMADPGKVGRGLARRVGSHKPYITPDFTTALGLFGNRHFPVGMGKFLNRMANKARPADYQQKEKITP
jgi:short-subunit dehydrogenase